MQYVVRDAMYTKFCQVPGNQPDICPSVGWLKDFADPETLLDPVFNGKNILDAGNSNFALLDDPKINEAMDKAEVDQRARPSATRRGARSTRWSPSTAAGIPWLWDKQPMLQSTDVNGVINEANASWDLTFTSIK